MNTRILSIAAIAALSAQTFAMGHSDWSVSAAYGVLMPVDSDSATGWTALTRHAGTGSTATTYTIDQAKQKNANFFDIAATHARSGFGLMYSATAKDTKFEITEDPVTTGVSDFIWKYNGVYATYQHPLGQMLDLTLAVGSVKQTFDNTTYSAPVSKRDLGARVGIGAFYNLSKEAALKLGLSYHYFKEFNQAYAFTGTPTDDQVTGATPKFDASGLAVSAALVYSM